MSYVMAMDQTITSESGYVAYGEAIVGSEGYCWGTPDIDTGDASGNDSYAYLMWAGDTDNGGLNTGNLPFCFDGNLATGVDTLSVDGTSITYDSNSSSATIGTVDLCVGADVPAQVSLDDIKVSFYQSGAFQETQSIPGISVDTTDSNSSGTAENIVTVIPSSTNDTEVSIAASFCMYAPDGTYPGPTDMFCQAFVKPSVAGH